MKLKCPDCDTGIDGRQIDVASNEAICPGCGARYAISQLIGVDGDVARAIREEESVPATFDIRCPPPGVTYENHGHGWCICASVRSWFSWMMIPAFLFINGINLIVVGGSQVIEGKFNPIMMLVGVPGFLIGIGVGLFTLIALCGKVIVLSDERDEDAGSVRLGVGPLGMTKRFRWSEVHSVSETESGGESNGRPVMQITLLRDEEDIHFGTLLPDHRRRYVIHALQQLTAKEPK